MPTLTKPTPPHDSTNLKINSADYSRIRVRTVSNKITQNPDGIDYIVELPNQKKIAVETPHWLRTPKPESLKARYDKLSAAVRAGAVQGAVLVTQIPDRTKSRSDSVGKPTDVQLAELNKLGETLKQF